MNRTYHYAVAALAALERAQKKNSDKKKGGQVMKRTPMTLEYLRAVSERADRWVAPLNTYKEEEA